MKYINNKGVEVEAFIEIVKERFGNIVTCADIREPTKEDIDRLKMVPCDHEHCTEQLIYDVPMLMYDFRYCAICGADLGTV